ncbi:alpha-hydroxy-acid oxidizing protein [Pseudarthrobacter sp. H2]|uniref:alpha-hydroxy-acid oxidizing protein n=1 Tax=Pseudarthrobacter sp. H2 TaxID=3418415 RepID=UPI003CEA2EC5
MFLEKHRPFESVAAIRAAAERFLPAPAVSLLDGGNQAGTTASANARIFDEIMLRSRLCQARHEVCTKAQVAGFAASLPLMIAPVAAQGLAPGAELGQARACAKAGIPLGVSNFASVPWRELTDAGADVVAQFYWVDGRERMAERLARARAAGVTSIILTLDWTFPAGRDWGTPAMPKALGWREALEWGPAALSRPSWFLPFVVKKSMPPLRAPNFADSVDADPTFPGVMARWKNTAYPRWDDVAWLREQWDGQLSVKGILEPDDAVAAVAAGANAVVVSNHGGNDMDSVVPSLAALPAVAAAVGGSVPVMFDGGIRRGADVIKALALGADSVLLGRAAAWATAARGEQGVAELLGLFDRDIRQTLRSIGVSSVKELSVDHLRQTPAFKGLAGAFAGEVPGQK